MGAGSKLFGAVVAVAVFLAVIGLLLLLIDNAPKRGRERIQAFLFMLPALIMLAIGLVVPVVRTTILSLSNDAGDRKSTRLNSSHGSISYAVFCLKKKNNIDFVSGIVAIIVMSLNCLM